MKKRFWAAMMVPVYVGVIVGCIWIAQVGSKTVTVIAESEPMLNRTCVIIDAGHGGEDGGATSCTGVLESQINLEIAIRLNDLLHLLGYDTVMIRTTDTAIYTEGHTLSAKKVSDLKNRVKIVNETPNALLISIHQNTFPDGKYSGAQVFCGKDSGSQKLAKQLQTTFIEAINPGSKRQVKPSDGIYLMQNITKPGVLIECGFISNVQEEAMLREKDYQQKIVCVIASCVSLYFSI